MDRALCFASIGRRLVREVCGPSFMAEGLLGEKRDPTAAFEFGRNWEQFSHLLNDERFGHATSELKRLLGVESLEGRTFLDIGCGSGLHSVAALRLGAAEVRAIDIDDVAVRTAIAVLSRYWNKDNYIVKLGSVFDLEPGGEGSFDVVYSWGVLHHTGDMWAAIGRAAGCVAPGGRLAIAIYRRTPLCGFWAWEKRIYTQSGPLLRAVLEGGFMALKVGHILVRMKNPMRKIRSYKQKRGMDWRTDVVDWLGGYPYQSATPDEVTRFVEGLGFRQIQRSRTLEGRRPWLGVLGTGNAEFLFERER